jgi:hypothetical protein
MRKELFNGSDFVRIKNKKGERLACPIWKIADPNDVSTIEQKKCVKDITAVKAASNRPSSSAL